MVTLVARSLRFLRVAVKSLWKKFSLIPSFCKICGVDIRDFCVEDSVWEQVANTFPSKKVDTVCYNCFCDASRSAGYTGIWWLEENTD